MAEKSESLAQTVASWPARVKNYIQELQLEMRRVTWPSWKQVRATTGVVLVCVFAFAAYFWVVDLILTSTLTRLYLALTK
ncbi:MAG: preprotein translocase subunit SecE, partial [Bryobacteraceae bacterium]|jgi:preprotein translocase subunit SecE|nr:preprotein translocase subunit SecE [Bryobacteraceae bacterium]